MQLHGASLPISLIGLLYTLCAKGQEWLGSHREALGELLEIPVYVLPLFEEAQLRILGESLPGDSLWVW